MGPGQLKWQVIVNILKREAKVLLRGEDEPTVPIMSFS
jgi:hypothetical protein